MRYTHRQKRTRQYNTFFSFFFKTSVYNDSTNIIYLTQKSYWNDGMWSFDGAQMEWTEKFVNCIAWIIIPYKTIYEVDKDAQKEHTEHWFLMKNVDNKRLRRTDRRSQPRGFPITESAGPSLPVWAGRFRTGGSEGWAPWPVPRKCFPARLLRKCHPWERITSIQSIIFQLRMRMIQISIRIKRKL